MYCLIFSRLLWGIKFLFFTNGKCERWRQCVSKDFDYSTSVSFSCWRKTTSLSYCKLIIILVVTRNCRLLLLAEDNFFNLL